LITIIEGFLQKYTTQELTTLSDLEISEGLSKYEGIDSDRFIEFAEILRDIANNDLYLLDAPSKHVKKHASYVIPDSMSIRKPNKIALSISDSIDAPLDMVNFYMFDDRFKDVIEIEEISITKVLRVKLICSSCKDGSQDVIKIKPMSLEQQYVGSVSEGGNGAFWHWQVIPKLPGKHTLLLTATTLIDRNGKEEVQETPIAHKQIIVESSFMDRFRYFVSKNIWPVLLIFLIVILLFFTKWVNPNIIKITTFQNQPSFLKEIESLIRKNKTGIALDRMLKYYYVRDRELYKMVIMYSAEFNDFDKKSKLNLLDTEQERKIAAKINYHILELIDSKK